jgi:hypothetical protein
MSDPSVVQRLSAADIPNNVALARAVGWPDVEDDGHVIHEAAIVAGIRSGS